MFQLDWKKAGSFGKTFRGALPASLLVATPNNEPTNNPTPTCATVCALETTRCTMVATTNAAKTIFWMLDADSHTNAVAKLAVWVWPDGMPNDLRRNLGQSGGLFCWTAFLMARFKKRLNTKLKR